MMPTDYQTFNYRDNPQKWEFLLVLGEIRVYGRSFFVVKDTLEKSESAGQVFIRELLYAVNSEKPNSPGNLLVSIESDELWSKIHQIALKERIVDR